MENDFSISEKCFCNQTFQFLYWEAAISWSVLENDFWILEIHSSLGQNICIYKWTFILQYHKMLFGPGFLDKENTLIFSNIRNWTIYITEGAKITSLWKRREQWYFEKKSTIRDVKIRHTKTRYNHIMICWDLCNYVCIKRLKDSGKWCIALCQAYRPTII